MGEFKGEVCWFNNAKGYGFVTSSQTKDVFCHYTAIQRDGYKTLQNGEPVEFDIVLGETGRRQAANVKPLGHPVSASHEVERHANQ